MKRRRGLESVGWRQRLSIPIRLTGGCTWIWSEAGEESGLTGAFERLLALVGPVFWKGMFFLFWFVVLGLATCEAPNLIAR